jgi:threonine-phosphate decarboxylase
MEVRHGGKEYLRRVLSGGENAENRAAEDGRLIDFSVNISPLGLPASVIAALRGDVAGFGGYPDPFCGKLRSALAARFAVPAGRIVCGAGAGDIIYRIARWKKPAKALITAPAFSDYEKALREVSCRIIYHELAESGFLVDRKILPKITEDARIVFLSNPNNPTGLTIGRDLLGQIVRRCDTLGVTLVIDECFNEFLDEPLSHTAIPYLDESPRLIILRAFTKIYAMAGLRLGYCLMGSGEDAGALADTGQAWPVSSPAQAAGLAALADDDYYDRTRALVKVERERLKTGLTKLGFENPAGEANFVFFRVTPASGFDNDSFFDSLLRHNILLRRCDNYRGLDGSYYRAAVLARAENDALLQVLAEIRGRTAAF